MNPLKRNKLISFSKKCRYKADYQLSTLLFLGLVGGTYSYSTKTLTPSSPSKSLIDGGFLPTQSLFKSPSTRSTHVVATSSTRDFERTVCDRNQYAKYSTPADLFYQKHGTLPKPSVMHESLDTLLKGDLRERGLGTCSQGSDDMRENGILVIGDVHGCLNELKTLVTKAVKEHNENQPFKCVLLVGDLVNKGPQSAQVIKFVREQRHWFSVRGNHDDGALSAALGDEKQLSKKKYSWVDRDDERNPKTSLTNEDVQWLAELPYTIKISAMDAGMETIIVHAGLMPGIPLENQLIKNMVIMREVLFDKEKKSYVGFENASVEMNEAQPWADVWSGPEYVVFGHDAKRGLQKHKFATGLDTGVCYGKKLTGIILPNKILVTVDAEAIHNPIK